MPICSKPTRDLRTAASPTTEINSARAATLITPRRGPASRPADAPPRRIDRPGAALLLQVDGEHTADHHPETAAELAALTIGSDDSDADEQAAEQAQAW